MHIPFDTRTVGYDDHFVQSGAGSSNNEPLSEPYHYFRGAQPWSQRGFGGIQSGAGIGDVLRRFWRIIMPVVRRAGAAVGKETLETGGRVLDRVVKGDAVKEAVISEGKKGIDTLLEKGGMTKQFGTGRRRRIKGKRRRQSHHILIGKRAIKPSAADEVATAAFPKTPTTNRRKRSDTFGLY